MSRAEGFGSDSQDKDDVGFLLHTQPRPLTAQTTLPWPPYPISPVPSPAALGCSLPSNPTPQRKHNSVLQHQVGL